MTTDEPEPFGAAILWSPGIVRVHAIARSDALPGAVGHYSADIPLSEIEQRGFRLERVPTQIGEQVRVFVVGS